MPVTAKSEKWKVKSATFQKAIAADLFVLAGCLGKEGGGCHEVRLLQYIDGRVHCEADKACHVQHLHNPVPALAPEPLVIPGHVFAG